MISQFDLTRFYDVISGNYVFKLGNLTRKVQIPIYFTFVLRNFFSKHLNDELLYGIIYRIAKDYQNL